MYSFYFPPFAIIKVHIKMDEMYIICPSNRQLTGIRAHRYAYMHAPALVFPFPVQYCRSVTRSEVQS